MRLFILERTMLSKAVIIGGTFDNRFGKSSAAVNAIANATGWPAINGGNSSFLQSFDPKNYDVVVWMPDNIDNAEENILPNFKKANPALMLISAIRVLKKGIGVFDVVTGLPKSKSNLGIMIEEDSYKLVDAIGNLYCDTNDAAELGRALRKRVETLGSLTRIHSKSFGARRFFPGPSYDAFNNVVRTYGNEFSKLINKLNPKRFLENPSALPTDRITRCCHGLFGCRLIKENETDAGVGAADEEEVSYLVSPRHIDKQILDVSDFVEVSNNENLVCYYGEERPFLDAPLEIMLLNYYHGVDFIAHGHVGVADAPYTTSKFPCGSIEEFGKIREIFPSRDAHNVSVNLEGHGCLIMGDLDYLLFQTSKLKSRPFPEP